MTEKVVSVNAKDILDLGTGPGQPSVLIAQSVPSARVHATDVQEAMVSKAKKRGEKLTNIDFSVMSADDLSALKPKSFDAVTMCYVLMFVPDKQKSLREIGRVLRAGGRAFVSVWRKMPFHTIAVDAFAEASGEMPKEMPVNPLALAQEHATRSLIEGTHGLLVLEREEMVSYPFPMGTGEEACDSAMIIVGSWVEKQKAEGKAGAREQFCSIFTKKLAEKGMKKENGTYEITGAAASLLTLKKPKSFSSGEL
eukprot:CAMPEP_0181514790 /NCGR_PEP_ID=MMETSP1110-20121109/63221_1 /TAXON_ID=174948 /ORGANISM="Symbiodinium sp., Strain CCMP421" /LENGTH=252 /DNA_ID=CAMNT_0023644749 /DNA_START=39 /DNA_END=797 /DNA_ORIENTATION=-